MLFKNFRYLDDLIHSGVKEIVLDSDIVLDDGEKSEYGEGIDLDVDGLVIDGNNRSIDAKGKTRIFKCSADGIVLKNVTLKNAFSGNGGAIENSGELTLEDSAFENNRAMNGGVIYNTGRMAIKDSTFKDNLTNFDGGGAIYNFRDAVMSISGSTFDSNRAEGMMNSGGTIRNFGRLTVTDSTISNSAALRGGAISNAGEARMNGCIISENEADDNGAIDNALGSFKMIDCEVSRNRSPKNIMGNNDYLEIVNSDFRDNHGANILANTDKSSLSISYGQFTANDADEAIVFNEGKFCIIEKTGFKSNECSKCMANHTEMTLKTPKMDGGAKTILNEGHLLVNGECENLLSRIYGEGTTECEPDMILGDEKSDFGYLDRIIHESTTGEIVLDADVSFEKYEANYYEGGIELDIDGLVIDGRGHTIDGASQSRIFIITGRNITLKNITFKNGYSHHNYDNERNSSGGAVMTHSKSSLTLKNCRFINNISEYNGGALCNYGNLTITESVFDENTLHAKIVGNGGAVINYGIMTIADSTFEKNRLQGVNYGGAVCNNAEMTIKESGFIENKAFSGGTIYNWGELTVTQSVFNRNNASYGGAIDNNGNLTVNDSAFNNNDSSEGGALYNENESRMTISGCAIKQNTALSGGALLNSGEVTVMNSIFLKNRAKYCGAISNSGTAEIVMSELTGNASLENSGAIGNGGQLTIKESMLLENAARERGGAINSWGEVTIKESVLASNTAHKKGGAIYLRRDSQKYESDNCIFKDNWPDDMSEEKSK